MHSTSKLFKLLLVGALASVLAACGNNTTSTSEADSKSAQLAPTTLTVDAYRPPADAAAESPMKSRDQSVAPIATNIALGAPQDSLTTAARKNNATAADDHMGKPLQIGFGRSVAQTATAVATNQVLKWQATKSGGQVAAINFNSTGAKGLRIGLLVTQLPETATLRFYAKGAATAFEVKGSEVLKVLAANLAAGDTTDEGRTYIGPMIRSIDATLEIELPAGVETSTVVVAVPLVSHMFTSMKEAELVTPQATYSNGANFSTQTCEVDVICATPLPAASDAVAWLLYNKAGGTYICSGTLLNDSINSGTPYILTANHCISDQTVASTLYTEFKYRSQTCNVAATGEYFPTATTGSALLYTAYSTDSTLVRLYGTPSAPNVLFAGWDSTVAPAVNTIIHSVHHPKGDQQRLTRGTIANYYTRTATGGLSDANVSTGTIIGVTQTSGNTEPGSSGSSLLKGVDASPVVIGQLFGRLVGGTPLDSCSDAVEKRIYGRFDMAYNAGMSDWLSPGVKSVVQFYNASAGVLYYTSGVTDASAFAAANPSYSNQGSVFKVSTAATAGLSPVYRFYNTATGTYFYTISEKERAAVATNSPRMRNDGIIWYASKTSTAANTAAVYSAFNATSGSQYFTTNLTTRNNFIASNPQFKADGIAFYVAP